MRIIHSRTSVIRTYCIGIVKACFSTTVIIIGVNPATQEVVEGNEALIEVEVLFGLLQRNVTIMLTTLDDSAQGIYGCFYLNILICD